MNKPIVEVKEKKYSVDRVSVVLKLNSGPLIHLSLSERLDGTENKLSNEETFKQEFLEHIYKEDEGSFQWQGTTLKFILVGYNSTEAKTFELVGLVVKKNVIDWFNENKFKEFKKQDYFIYQKSNGVNSWPFFNQVLSKKFESPNEAFKEKIGLLFPENGCIWRYRDSNNFHFLNRTIAFTSRHLPEVQGWCAFDSEIPLRLILFEEKKQDNSIPKLDQTWNPSHLFLPNRYSWNRWLDRSCTLSRDLSINTGQEIALIKQLVSDGSNGEDAQKGKNFQAQNPTRLLFVPGTINIGDRNIFCHTVSYEFKLPAFEEKESPSVTMKIEMDYPERQIGDNEVVSLRLSGKFQKWEKEKDEETKVKIAPPDLNNWGIIDEKNQTLKSGNDAVLYTQILSPTYSDKKYSGIYIKHEKDDEMIVDIHPCGIPLVLGSIQKYRPELEKADITLCGEKLAISVSSHNQSLASAEAIILDNSEIKLNHGKKIFGQAQQKVDFLSKNIELGSTQLNIKSAQTKINSLVNVSLPSPQMPKPIVPSSLGGLDMANEKPLITIDNQNFEVGSASGENNLCLLDTFAQLANKYTNSNGSPDELKDIFKTFLADETGLINVGSEQDFMDRNISENLLLALSHENKENFEIQVYDQSPDGSITKYDKFTAKDQVTGEDQYPGKKPIVLQMLRSKTGEDQHHFVPLFPREQAVGANHETQTKELPAELLGGGKESPKKKPLATKKPPPVTKKRLPLRRSVRKQDIEKKIRNALPPTPEGIIGHYYRGDENQKGLREYDPKTIEKKIYDDIAQAQPVNNVTEELKRFAAECNTKGDFFNAIPEEIERNGKTIKRPRIVAARITNMDGMRKKIGASDPYGGIRTERDDRGHLAPEAGVSDQHLEKVNSPDNVIAETWSINQKYKTVFEKVAKELSIKHSVITIHIPNYKSKKGDEASFRPRPKSVTHILVLDGIIKSAFTLKNSKKIYIPRNT